MKNRFTALACLAFVLLFAAAASAQMGMGPGGGPGYGPGGGMMGGGPGYGMMGGGPGYGGWDNYRLTPEQQKAYQAIADKYQADFAKLASEMWAKRAQLNAVLAQEKIDRSQAKTLAGEIGELSARACAMRVDMLVDLRESGISYYGLDMMHGGMMHGGMMGYGMMGGPWHRGNMPGYGGTR